ncbi:MAG: hypothetical protein DI570_20740 [Phenylobacterium zucineum]|nr:MAG: hypothetical protein DI570_20740 [Phenylobacterium zucineum]
MRIDPARAYLPCEPAGAPASCERDAVGAPARSWRPAPAGPAQEALPGWWVTAGYWDREAVEGWFARRN